jgi:uroporphyrinogen III methyltransferase/synthase
VPSTYRSEELAAELVPLVRGQRVLLARADRGRDVLREQLAAVARVEQVAVYSQEDETEADPAVLARLRHGDVDYITLTSPNIARALARRLDAPTQALIREGRLKLVTISPVTSEAVRDLGWPVAAEATVYTTAGVIDALVAHAQK